MADGYSWSESRDGGSYRLPGPEHLRWWATVAMLLSILLHIVVFFSLERMKIALHFEPPREIRTRSIPMRQVEVRPLETEHPQPDDAVVTPPKEAASLMEEVDLLSALPKDLEIDIKPAIQEAEYALQMKRPAMQGDPSAMAQEISSGLEVSTDLPELGRQPEHLRPAETGQLTVDPGAVQMDDHELGKFTEDLIKRGAKGNVEKGALTGMASLDDLLDLPPNILLGKMTMLPSDLLFEFNRADLRESAKVGLMKLALLMDRNPTLYCWIEGHTDLVGGDDFNLDLSVRRAAAVKNYLASSLRMDESKISIRGFGRRAPLVTRGTTDEQAVNRRVEIRMRQSPAPNDSLFKTPQKATIIEPAKSPKPLLVKPKRVLPLDDDAPPPSASPRPAPKATRVDDDELAPKAPKATPVDDEERAPAAPKATPVDGEPLSTAPRAQPVDE